MQDVLEHPFLKRAVDATQNQLDSLHCKMDDAKRQNDVTLKSLGSLHCKVDDLSNQLDSVRRSVLRGMLSIDQAPIPSLWILVPPPSQVAAPPSFMFVFV
jgi:hypothetical protein